MALKIADILFTPAADGLEDEVIRLQDKVQQLTAALELERRLNMTLTATVEQLEHRVEQTTYRYEMEDDDEAASAFDEFMSQPDSYLDKVRSFLLD